MQARVFRRHLLIDADILAFKTCAALETAVDWGDGYWTWHVNEEDVKQAILEQIDTLSENLDAVSFDLCLSDTSNFRYDILPTYKGNRKGTKRPLLLKHIRQWMIDELLAVVWPGLEGDDVLGILATQDSWARGKEKVIVSLDKDMKTIPCLYYRDEETGLIKITKKDADEWHLIQTLAGDVTDGYGGCPGIGMERATKAIKEPTVLVPFEHVITRGPRKGESETRYTEEPTFDLWAAVVSRYEAAGLSEEEALTQARVARILRASDFDFEFKRPIPWSPYR